MHPPQLKIDEIFNYYKTSLDGLSSDEVKNRLAKNGPNVISSSKKHSPFWMFFNQFKDVIIFILMIAALVSGLIGDWTDSIIIISIVIINAIVGFVQEYNADKALEALKKMSVLHSKVVREGIIEEILSVSLVVGDLVILEAGNSVPADLRLVEVNSLRIDESSLTGESENVLKNSDPMEDEQAALADRLNMTYKGSMVTNGRAKGIVTAIGMDTELGKIASMLQVEETDTPLKIRMKKFGKNLSYFIILICLILFGVGVLRGEDVMVMLLLSISLAVAAIPEALPALMTVSLAKGAKRMVRKNALIRKLPAVETLGSVSIICTDKTGTLTMNKMKLIHHFDTGDALPNEPSVLWLGIALNHDLVIDTDHKLKGDATELAMVEEFVDRFESSQLDKTLQLYPRVAEIPFDSVRKCMSTIHKFDDRFLVITKGAIESILKNSIQNFVHASEITSLANQWAKTGHRVIAFAFKIVEQIPEADQMASLEKDLIPCGLMAMMDPPRFEVKEAIAECKKAGVRTIMITGDHLLTAQAIASEIGLLMEDGESMTGKEMALMSDEDFSNKIEKCVVYARVSPEQKLKIINALKKKGYFVAMTGDGVNDAPSLKAADIGVAMGINGTDVSKEASDMVLLDDRFNTIVSAIKEGRRIYDNIRKFVKYIMTCNSAEIWTLFLAPLLGLPIPLLPVHILWINLVTDGLPGLALAGEKSEPDTMLRPPRPAQESLFAEGVGWHILWVGILMAGLTLAVQAWCVHHQVSNWQTMVFTVLAFTQLAHALSIRGERTYLFIQGIFSNKMMIFSVVLTFLLQMFVIYHPWMNEIFKTKPLSFYQLLSCIAVAAILFHAVEFEKWIRLKIKKNYV
ncbi:MAG: cation-translocating P-type ATPase [Saprospiraceae bacterium]|nr:cation-translocating P-type ATPase [Saprospiraceae bacterium]MBK9630662.1 cation-translocating P-type ATPase [Saprospiraceae bacterium]